MSLQRPIIEGLKGWKPKQEMKSSLTTVYYFEGVHLDNQKLQASSTKNQHIASYCILLKSWKGLELVCKLLKTDKRLSEMFDISCGNIWPNFILTLPRILKKQLKIELLMFSNIHDNIADLEVCGLIKITKT